MTQTSDPVDLDAAARRVDVAVERAGLLDGESRRVAMDLKAAIEAFHREGLVRLVRRVVQDPRGKDLMAEAVDDPVVYALLVMHGIVRADPLTLARQALEEVRPYLHSHGGGVELVGVEPPVVRVRLSGACTGCSQSATTLREVVERALAARVPGLERVEVVPSEPAPAVIPLEAVGVRAREAATSRAPADLAAAGWRAGPAWDDVADGAVTRWLPGGSAARPGGPVGGRDRALILVRLGERLAAYADACAHRGLSLEKALLDAEGAVLTCPWHGMKYRALTGECLSATDTRLTAYPARIEDGRVWVHLPE
jgi:Fe-S cluster biogenesis protein NfuA/nitrite reductase/ring-hydroxylating ferredoxin subunit